MDRYDQSIFTIYITNKNRKFFIKVKKDLSKLTKKGKERYIEETIEDGIYIHQPPIGEGIPMFYRCINCMKKFDFLQPDDLYIRKYGREIKMLQKQWVGSLYCIRLKQSDRRGFSARSTGAIDNKGLPTRSFKSRAHLEQRSTSCIRFEIPNHYIEICS